jgi:hypothetical protein
MEIWKDIINYEGLYQISNLGLVKSLKRKSGGRNYNESFLKHLLSNGYYKVSLSKNGKVKTFPIHRLIAIHFIDNPKNLKCVNHIDHNRLNNSLNNLEWTSYRENNSYRINRKNFTSQYLGVSWSNTKNKWQTQINYNNKVLHLGTFDDELEAYQTRVNFEIKNNIQNKYL